MQLATLMLLSMTFPASAEVEAVSEAAAASAPEPVTEGVVGLYGSPEGLALAFSPLFV